MEEGSTSKGKGGTGEKRGGISVSGMGRKVVPDIVNGECEKAVNDGLAWQEKDGVQGLTTGKEWTAKGKKLMKEVVRRLVTSGRWEEVQLDICNLGGLSAENLEEPSKWPHAAKMQLEYWVSIQMQAMRYKYRKAGMLNAWWRASCLPALHLQTKVHQQLLYLEKMQPVCMHCTQMKLSVRGFECMHACSYESALLASIASAKVESSNFTESSSYACTAH